MMTTTTTYNSIILSSLMTLLLFSSTNAASLRGLEATKCIGEVDMAATIDAFAQTVVSVSDSYKLDGCQGAYRGALGALQGAYGYNFGPVLFKPTLTSLPYVTRNTLPGALSYFIGTDCLNEIGRAHV